MPQARLTIGRAPADQAGYAIAFADRLISWFAQRLALADRGPLRGVLIAALDEARRLYADEAASAEG
jgi:hypothetical protein